MDGFKVKEREEEMIALFGSKAVEATTSPCSLSMEDCLTLDFPGSVDDQAVIQGFVG